MPGGECLLGDPKRQASPPDQSRIIIGPVRHPIAHLWDLVAPVSIGFVGHGPISQRNQPVLQAAAGSVTRPGHNLWSIHAPTPLCGALYRTTIHALLAEFGSSESREGMVEDLEMVFEPLPGEALTRTSDLNSLQVTDNKQFSAKKP